MVTRRFIVQAVLIAAATIAILAVEDHASDASAQTRPAPKPKIVVVKPTPAAADSPHRVSRFTPPPEKPKAATAK